jgi:hypothetical protein
MAGRCDRDGDGHSPVVTARRAQVDRARPPPVNGILWIHHVENWGLIHVDGEGGQWIPIVDDAIGFLGGALRGVRSHAVDETIFRHKARNGRLLRRKSLVGENRIQLSGLSDEAKTRDKDSLPTPVAHKRDQLLC